LVAVAQALVEEITVEINQVMANQIQVVVVVVEAKLEHISTMAGLEL
jgi:hypothetical protein